ncbi:MAG: TerC family protein, partial [Candidatus Sulfotelmatobacter sp.]
LFFAVSGLMKVFRFLHTGLALILVLMGLKMIAADYYKVPTLAMLGVVAGVLMISMVASLLFPGQNRAK